MKKYVMLTGMGNSGKSTYGKELKKRYEADHKKVAFVRYDSLARDNHTNDPTVIKPLFYEEIQKALNDKTVNVVITDLAENTAYDRANDLNNLKLDGENIEFYCVYLHSDIGVILERMKKRYGGRPLSPDTIEWLTRIHSEEEAPKKAEFKAYNFAKVTVKDIKGEFNVEEANMDYLLK